MQLRIKVEGILVPEVSSPPSEERCNTDIFYLGDDDDKPLELDEEDPRLREPDPDTERNRLPSPGGRVESPSATGGPATQREADAQPPETVLHDLVDGGEELPATQPDEDTQPQETLLYDP